MGREAERRPRSGEIRPAVAEHDRVQVDPMLIDQAEFGEASRQRWASNLDLAGALGLQLTDRALELTRNESALLGSGLGESGGAPVSRGPAQLITKHPKPSQCRMLPDFNCSRSSTG
jgi:hypothetical protein